MPTDLGLATKGFQKNKRGPAPPPTLSSATGYWVGQRVWRSEGGSLECQSVSRTCMGSDWEEWRRASLALARRPMAVAAKSGGGRRGRFIPPFPLGARSSPKERGGEALLLFFFSLHACPRFIARKKGGKEREREGRGGGKRWRCFFLAGGGEGIDNTWLAKCLHSKEGFALNRSEIILFDE